MKAASSLARLAACAVFVLIPIAGLGATSGGNILPAAAQQERSAGIRCAATATGFALATRSDWNVRDRAAGGAGSAAGTKVLADQMSFAPARRRPSLQVGESYDPAKVHLVTEPGRYGLGTPPQGSQYAVIDSYLVRVEPGSMKVLSVIRLVNEILD